jgi:hypothetical protein
MVEILIPMVPDGKLRPNARPHFYAKNTAQQELRAAAKYAGLRTSPITGPVTIHYHIAWPKGRRLHDLDAIPVMCKGALDGIVDAGVLVDDGPKYIVGISASQEKTAGDGMTIIRIDAA